MRGLRLRVVRVVDLREGFVEGACADVSMRFVGWGDRSSDVDLSEGESFRGVR